MSLTPRTATMRAKMVTTPAICVERLKYMTQSYRETECEPELIRRAKALACILAHMSIRIDEGELFVGNFTSKVRGGAVLPEIKGQWLLDERDTLTTRPFDRFAPLSEEEWAVLEEALPYWREKDLCAWLMARLPDDALKV